MLSMTGGNKISCIFIIFQLQTKMTKHTANSSEWCRLPFTFVLIDMIRL